MGILKTSFNQDSNIGLYGFATDEYCILSNMVNKLERIEDALGVDCYQSNLCGTHLTGTFLAGNSNGVLIPQISLKSERRRLNEWGIDFKVIDSKHTALGNNIVCDENTCLINPGLKDHKEEISEFLDVNVEELSIMKVNTVGSLIVINDNGCLLSAIGSEEDEEKIEKLLDKPVKRGTVNLGNTYIRSGLIANSNGFIMGKNTGGPEANLISESLGFN